MEGVHLPWKVSSVHALTPTSDLPRLESIFDVVAETFPKQLFRFVFSSFRVRVCEGRSLLSPLSEVKLLARVCSIFKFYFKIVFRWSSATTLLLCENASLIAHLEPQNLIYLPSVDVLAVCQYTCSGQTISKEGPIYTLYVSDSPTAAWCPLFG